jgi:hypothetical protein
MGHKVIRVTRIARRRQQPPFHRLYNSARGYLGEYVCEGATVAFAFGVAAMTGLFFIIVHSKIAHSIL